MLRFGAKAEELHAAGVVQVFGVSGDSPFAHSAWAERIGLETPLLSDYNHEAAAAFGILREELFGCFRPLNTRAAFLVGEDGVVLYAWTAADPSTLPDPEPLVEAAQALGRSG